MHPGDNPDSPSSTEACHVQPCACRRRRSATMADVELAGGEEPSRARGLLGVLCVEAPER
jgi:hypothetical protein